ncbi:MAG: hypothetical protein II502_04600 [Paludibacteraceae bacterium]|nr:hypothetical protein [Paludibacteraceae bacterium]
MAYFSNSAKFLAIFSGLFFAYINLFLLLSHRIYAEAVFYGGWMWVQYILMAFIDALLLANQKLRKLFIYQTFTK